MTHIRFAAEPELLRLLDLRKVLGHSFVSGEVAMGSLKDKSKILEYLDDLTQATAASEDEVRSLIESEKLYGRGIGYIDAHLIASVRLTPYALLWTRDKRLHEVASELGLAFQEARPN